MEKKTIGIIGGMGPLATADLFRKIVLNTKADRDQDHIRILIDNNTNIPDRTAAILHHGENPIPELTKSAVTLQAMGAQILVMPCNTAHYFYADVQKSVDIPVLHMIELTQKALIKKGIQKVGLLATEGTVNSGIYQDVFAKGGIEIVLPNKQGQDAIMDLIYGGVKAGKTDYDVTKVRKVMEDMLDRGAQTLILGCTELPVAVDMYGLDYNTCDPTLMLARGAIEAAGGTVCDTLG